MAVYRKLLCIQFHHKYFDVFCDENHRKAFLEVKKQNNVKKYYYPELFDYIYLNSIYNKKSDGILRAKKYSFQQKLLIGGIGIVIGTSFLSLMEDSHTNIHFNNQFLSSTIEIDPKKGLEEEELSSISHQVTLEDCGLSTVSFDDLRKTVDSNPSIDMNSKNDIHIFLNNLEQKEPTSEIRILNENLKTLKIKIIPNNEWTMTGVDGFYNSATNTIHLKEDYESITYRKNVIFHELGHLLNNINLKINNQVTHFNYYHYDDNYGKALSEGFDTVFMNYLLSDNYHTYFDDPYKKYINYENTAAIAYQIVKLLDYDFSTYSKENIFDLREKLKKENLEYLIDALDAHLETNDAEYITIEEENLLRENLTILLKKRLKQELKNRSGITLLESYQFALNFFNQFQSCYNNYYLQEVLMELFAVCNEEVEEQNSDFKVCGIFQGQLADDNFVIKDVGQKTVNKQLDKLFFYPTVEDGTIVMRIYYLLETDKWRAYDIETNDEVDFLNTVSIPVQSYLKTLLPITLSDYQLEIDKNIFKTEDFFHFISKKFWRELMKEGNINRILDTSLKGENYCKDLSYPLTLDECKQQILKNRIEGMYQLGYQEIEIHEMVCDFPLDDTLKYQITMPGIYQFTGVAGLKADRTIRKNGEYLAGSSKIFEKDGKVSAYAAKFLIYPIEEGEVTTFGLCVLEAVDRTENNELVLKPYDVVTKEPIDEKAPCLPLETFLQELAKKYATNSYYDILKYNMDIDISFLQTKDLSKIVIEKLGDVLLNYEPSEIGSINQK